jgi:hypothetical protein
LKSLELLSPKGLWLLGLLAPLVVLYILKIRRERRTVASTWLWATAQRDLLARSPFKKLVAEVPLLLEALAVIALALALARPATRGGGIAGEHVAIVIDTSASMSALSPDGAAKYVPRIELARRAAKDLLLSLGPGADAMVFEAGRETRILAPLDRDLLRVQRSFEKLEARDVEGDLGAAVALAVDRLRQLSGARRIVVFTDGNLAHPEALGAAALPIEIVRVGAAIENTAIVRVDVRSGNDEATKEEQVQAFLLVANFGFKPRELYVTMREHNTSDVLASRRVMVQPGERLPVVLTFHPTRGDYGKGLVFDIAPHDAMAVDDVAFGRVPAGDRLPAFLAGASPSPWLERALVSDPMLDLKKGTVGDLGASASVDQGTLVVVDGACPSDPPGGDLLIVHPPAGRCFATEVGKALEQPVVTSWENGDARLRFLTLDGLHVAHANRLAPEGAAQELVRTQDGPIATDGSTPARTVTLLGFDVGDSDWPLKASYVLFMRNVIELARAHRAHGVTGPARAGEPMRVSIPAGATEVKATGAHGEPVEVSVRGGVAVVPDVPHAGFYQVSWSGAHPGSVLVPANLTSTAESDLTPRALPQTSGVSILAAADAKPEAHTEWSWLLALFALLLVVADVAYLTRAPRRSSVATPARPRVPDRVRRAA